MSDMDEKFITSYDEQNAKFHGLSIETFTTPWRETAENCGIPLHVLRVLADLDDDEAENLDREPRYIRDIEVNRRIKETIEFLIRCAGRSKNCSPNWNKTPQPTIPGEPLPEPRTTEELLEPLTPPVIEVPESDSPDLAELRGSEDGCCC